MNTRRARQQRRAVRYQPTRSSRVLATERKAAVRYKRTNKEGECGRISSRLASTDKRAITRAFGKTTNLNGTEM